MKQKMANGNELKLFELSFHRRKGKGYKMKALYAEITRNWR